MVFVPDTIVAGILILPGFYCLYLILLAIKAKKLGKFETILFSLGLSMTIFFLAMPINATMFPDISVTKFDDLIHLIFGQNALKYFASVVATGAIVIIIIVGISKIKRFAYGEPAVEFGDAWSNTFREMARDGALILVITKDEKQYIGQLDRVGIDDDKRDITIREPKLLLNRKKVKFGKKIIFTPQNIQRIIWLEHKQKKTKTQN